VYGRKIDDCRAEMNGAALDMDRLTYNATNENNDVARDDER